MDKKDETYFMSLTPSEKIIFVLKSHEDFGGPQSADILCKFLGMKRKNLDSLLSRLCQKGRIQRIHPGIYGYPGDSREPKY
ncbi:type IV toxin-antitoxin system AbiEi family antitoxin domain-containing protein [Candidatus Nitrosotenuis uzonensis]|uniref:type IV toxin-antitoxin system AbiEi family antitoxin domain-containing protein n=1 Tax=Candidatus Nitrosotenuis uzonensis TaxID=1407055 RepID=UPI001960E355|nr:type IV toxin-antitoxin system AbiEi family antitoxin domain-containing protein [Candidatus Nitrosotenuis uzonensis]